MLFLLAMIPWVLTVIALLYIIVIKQKTNVQFSEEEEDFLFDDDESQEVVRIAVYEDKAYWVYENVFYQSDVIREPDFSTAEPIDTMDLNPKELNRLMGILDELQNNERD
jgi:hypothetical protein